MDNVDSVVEKYDKATRKGSKSDALEDIYDLKEKLEKNDHFLTEVSNKNDILTKENKKLKEEKAVLVKEKDEALSRLSKMAGQKLTEGNPAITDLGNPNRPAKIGERWGSLYSDEWTDVFEEIFQKNEKMGNEDETPEKQLLKIVDWCYKKCTEIFNSQNTLMHEKVWELVSILHLPGVKEITLKKNQRINAYDQKGKENAVLIEASESFLQTAKEQRLCSCTLVDSVKKKCSDDYISLNKTTSGTEKEFVRKCSELCWYMVCSDPPMAIEYENIENKSMDSSKFNKYNRTGTIVEYVVWPVLLLHIDGPVLAKGSVQTNIEPTIGRLVARKKSVESVIAPPLACRAISSDEHVTFTSQSTNNNTKSESIQVQNIQNKKTVTDQLEISDIVVDLKDSSQKDQSIRQNKGKLDDDSNMCEAGTLKHPNGPNVINGVVLTSAKLDQRRSVDLNAAQYKSNKTCTTGVNQSTNVSSDTSRNKNISDSAEKISTDNSKSDFGEITKSKCAEFMKSEENVVKMIDDDKYNANFLLQSRRRHLLKSQSMIEEHDREPNERDVPNCDNKTKRLNGINRTVSTSFLGESISRNNTKMFNTKYYGKPENIVECMPSHTDTFKRTFDKAAERSKIQQQLTKGKEQTKV
ncbi:Hypothetical predicted protein [Mytilus galloprovincialis]|uniref:Mitochondria-eating protein n=1 Tax=Mytilus galloprovincialis TaxID=29158 RepID=A0A8B6EAL9_MYTGA|nr:Hypothetical predicted protein [Mytilus galloprovincialis]